MQKFINQDGVQKELNDFQAWENNKSSSTKFFAIQIQSQKINCIQQRSSICNHFFVDSLRGGGCVTSKVQPLEQLEQINFPCNFISNLFSYAQQINEKSKLTIRDDTKDELLIAIQWFIFNKYYINRLVNDRRKSKQYQNTIIDSIKEIVESIPILVKNSCFICHEVLQILNDLLRFVFIRIKEDKTFTVEIQLQDRLKELITQAENQIQGNSIQIWETGIKFELQMAKFVINNFRTNEIQDIFQNMIKGTVFTILTQNFTEGFLESIYNFGRYLFRLAESKLSEREYEYYFFFEQFKWILIVQLQEKEGDLIQLKQQLQEAYKKHIANSKNWMIHFCWVRLLSDLISYRPQIQKKRFFENMDSIMQNQNWEIEKNLGNIQISSFDQNYGRIIFNKNNLNEKYRKYSKIDEFQQFLVQEYNRNNDVQTFKTLLDYVEIKLNFDEQENGSINLFNQLVFENSNVEFLKQNIEQINSLNQQNEAFAVNFTNNSQQKLLDQINDNLFMLTQLSQEIYIQFCLFSNQANLASKLCGKEMNQEINGMQINLEIKDEDFNQVALNNNQIMQYQYDILKMKLEDYNQLKDKISQVSECCTRNIRIFNELFDKVLQIEKNCLEILQNPDSKIIDIPNVDDFHQLLRKIFVFKIFQEYINKICEQLKKNETNLDQLQKLKQQINLLQLLDRIVDQLYLKYKQIKEGIQLILENENNLLLLIESKKQQQNLDSNKWIQSFLIKEEDQLKQLQLASSLSIDQSKLEDLINLIENHIEIVEQNQEKTTQQQLYLQQTTKITMLLLKMKSNQDIRQELDNISEIYRSSIKEMVGEIIQQQKGLRQNTQGRQTLNDQNQITRDDQQQKQLLIKQLKDMETNMKNFKDKIQNYIKELKSFQRYFTYNRRDNNNDENNFQDLLNKLNQTFQETTFQEIQQANYYQFDRIENIQFKFNIVATFLQNIANSLKVTCSNLDNNQRSLESKVSIKNQNSNQKENCNDYRVRECLFFNVMKIQNAIKEPKIIQFCQLIIQQLWMMEKNENVRNIFKDQEMINQQKKLYSHELNTFSQKLQKKFRQKLGELQKLEAEFRQEGLINDKFELKKKLQEKQNEFQNYLKNINEMTQQINISFVFLQEIHKEMSILQNKIDKIQTNVDDILTDIRQLRGKTYKELLTMRKNKILHEQQITDMNSIYIELKTIRKCYQSERQPLQETQVDTVLLQEKENEIIFNQTQKTQQKEADVSHFFDQKKNFDVMLIRGQAGSGKSRAAKKIEEYIWKLHQGRSEDWIPIFISLPSLKDPKKNLFNEALESDFYHFDKIQIKELKDAIYSNRERIVLILDSYDELKNDVKKQNLYETNEFAQQFNIKINGVGRNVKTIITTRSELLQDKNFIRWFTGDNIQNLLDIDLQQFKEKEIKGYLLEYSILSVRKKIFGLYEYIQQIQGNNVNSEEVRQIQIAIDPHLSSLYIENDNQTLINAQKAKQIIETIKLIPQFKYLREDQRIILEKELLELWSQKKFKDSIDNLQINSILQTPYMMEIVVQVLPNFSKIYSEASQIREIFKINYLTIKKSQEYSKQIIEKYKIQKQSNNIEQSQKIDPDSQIKKIESQEIELDSQLKKQVKELMDKMDKIKFFQNFSILNVDQINLYEDSELKQEEKNILISAFRMKRFTTYEFYENFIQFYHSQQIVKQQRLGNVQNYEILLIDIWEYAESLALDMILNDQTYFTHQVSGVLKLQKAQKTKEQLKNWCDQYFFEGTQEDQEYKKIIRSCILLTCKGNVYSFTHKSIQEFFGAKYVINLFSDFINKQKIDDKIVYEIDDKSLQQSLFNEDRFNISKTSFQKISEFITNYYQGKEQDMIDKLIEVLKYSQQKENFCRSASNSIYLLSQFKAYLGELVLEKIQISDTKINGLSFFKSIISKSYFQNVEIDGCNFNKAKIKDSTWKVICNEQRTLSVHNSKVTAMIMSSDGKLLFSASEKGEIIIWDYTKREVLKKLENQDNQNEIKCLAISQDGKLLASASKNEIISLWDCENFIPLNQLVGHKKQVNSIAFSLDKNKKLLASGSSDQTILFWDWEQGKQIKQTLKHDTDVMQVIIFKNSKLLASRTLDNIIKLWNIEQEYPEVIRIFLNYKNQNLELTSISISLDGEYLVAGNKNNGGTDQICVRAWEIKQDQKESFQTNYKIYCLAISFNYIKIIGGSKNQILIWNQDFRTQKMDEVEAVEVVEIDADGNINALTLSKDEKLLASGSDKGIILWNYEGNSITKYQFQPNITSQITMLEFAQFENIEYLFFLQNEELSIQNEQYEDNQDQNGQRTLYYFKIGRQQAFDIVDVTQQECFQKIVFSGRNQFIIFGFLDGTITINKIFEQGNQKHIVEFHQYYDHLEENSNTRIIDMVLISDENFLAAGYDNNKIYIFNISDGVDEKKDYIINCEKTFTSLSYLKAPNLLSIGNIDKSITLMNCEENKTIEKIVNYSGQISSMMSSKNGDRLFFRISNDKENDKIGSLSFEESSKQFKGNLEEVNQIVFSPSDDIFLGIGNNHLLHIWEFQNQKLKPSPLSKKVALTCATISLENNLITGQEDGSIIVWQMKNEEENKMFDGHTGQINCLCFSPDGLHIVSSSQEDNTFIWDIQKKKKIIINQPALQIIFSPNYLSEQKLIMRQEQEIIIWDIIQAKQIISLELNQQITSMDLIGEDQNYKIICGLADGNIIIWKRNENNQFITLEKKHQEKVNSLSVQQKGNLLVSGSDDTKIGIWIKNQQNQDQSFIYIFRDFKINHNSQVQVVLFSPDGQQLVSGDIKGTINIWKINELYLDYKTFPKYEKQILFFAFSQNGQILASGYNDNTIKLWDVQKLQLIQSFEMEGQNENLGQIVFSIDGKFAYSFGSDISLCKCCEDQSNKEYIVYQTIAKYPLLQADKCLIERSKILQATDTKSTLSTLFKEKKAIIIE